MFYYWLPKGARALGLGCLLIGGILDHHKNKESDKKINKYKN